MKPYLTIALYPPVAVFGTIAADRADLFIPGLFGFGLILPMVMMAAMIRREK